MELEELMTRFSPQQGGSEKVHIQFKLSAGSDEGAKDWNRIHKFSVCVE